MVRVDAVTGILTLVAGNGAAASSGDGGPAVLASINGPMGVALDGAGNLYISEYQGYRIRRVDAQTGVITTVAGTGAPGLSVDGVPATSAGMGTPMGMAFDSTGNLYFADLSNRRVRRIAAATGIITTVAGNGTNAFTPDGALAAGASLAVPVWVALDHSGGLLVSEMNSYRIRRIDLSSGILTTVAGNGSPDFTGDGVPATSAGIGTSIGMVVAPNGDLFFADGTGRVRKVDAVTGSIITVAGNGTGPHGMTSASSSGSGSGGGSSSPSASCNPTVVGDGMPGPRATLDGPLGVQLTSDGSLLIADSLDCRIRRVGLPSPFSYTNTTLATNATTLQPNQSVLLTATVSPIGLSAVPTGTMWFLDNLWGAVTVLGCLWGRCLV